MAKLKNPETKELAPATAFSSASLITDPYLKALANPDPIIATKGGGNLGVYSELLRDDQVQSTFQQRRSAVISADWDVLPGAEDAASTQAAEALKEVLDGINWDEITEQMMYSVFYGYGVAEVMWQPKDGRIDFDIKVRDRDRFRFGLNDRLFLRNNSFGFDEMPDRKFWTLSVGADNADNPYGRGLGYYLYWPCYFKRSDIKFWLIFLEKFGAPTPIGKLPAGKADDVTARNKLLTALSAIVTDAAVVIPDGAEIELLEAARSGSGSYDVMLDKMDAAIAKIILSQTMTTDNGSSRSQAEVHEGVRDQVVKSDSDLICESFNRTVVKWWTEYNFPTAVPPKVWRDTDPPADLNAIAERDEKIYKLGYEPTEEYVQKTYGDGWVKRKVQPAPMLGNPFSQGANDDGSDFAETAFLAAMKAGQRFDQNTLVNEAARYASKYNTILGQRVQQLLDYADASEDYETFQKRLTALFSEQPTPGQYQTVERAGFIARLMGMLRAQRDPKTEQSQ